MKRTRKQIARDFALYIAITIAVFGTIFAAAVYDWHPDGVAKGIFATFYTAIIFGPFLYKARLHSRLPRFWFGTLSLLAMHCGVLMFLDKQQHITVWLLGPIMAIEYGTLKLWADDLAKPRRSHV